MSRDRLRSRFYQEIAKAFLVRRGAPFFLSSKDMTLISSWEKIGIPLRAVLEGIEQSFDAYRRRPSSRRKVQSLSFCERNVLKVFSQYREGRVGRQRKAESRADKKKRIIAEVKKFLERIPPGTDTLREIYEETLRVLHRRSLDEKKLEELEGEIESALLRQAQQEEEEEVKRDVRAEFTNLSKEEFRRIVDTKLIKFLREKYKIPYVSFYFY